MAAIVGEERYVFNVQWYDQAASVIRDYRITYFPGDQTIEQVSWFQANWGIVWLEEQAHIFETVPICRYHKGRVLHWSYPYCLWQTAQNCWLRWCGHEEEVWAGASEDFRHDQAWCLHSHWKDHWRYLPNWLQDLKIEDVSLQQRLIRRVLWRA